MRSIRSRVRHCLSFSRWLICWLLEPTGGLCHVNKPCVDGSLLARDVCMRRCKSSPRKRRDFPVCGRSKTLPPVAFDPDQMLKHRPDTTLAALENRCTRERTEGSNPDLSASFFSIDDVV